MINDKKGQDSFSVLQAIPRFIFLIIMGFSLLFLIKGYVANNLNVQDVQADVFINRILYSPNGISYHDKELKLSVTGMIDPSRITNENLDSMMLYEDKNFIAGSVQLVDKDGKEVSSAIYNEKTFRKWMPIAEVKKFTGEGAIKKIERASFVNYIDSKGIQKRGTLKFIVLEPGN